MNNTYIFELSQAPISNRIESWELSHHFYSKNPYWSEEGELLELSDDERQNALEYLIDELPQGYLMDPVDERIDIKGHDAYLQGTINPSLPIGYPLGWWKKKESLFNDILIYFEEEYFTIHEFLLYMISASMDHGIWKLYIGGVYEYYI